MKNLIARTDSTTQSTFSDLSLENVAANTPDSTKTLANVYYNRVMQASIWVQYEVTLNESSVDEVEAYLRTHIQFANTSSLGIVSDKVEKEDENGFIHDYTLGDVKQVNPTVEHKTANATTKGWVNIFLRPKDQGTYELVPFIDNQADSSLEITKKVTIDAVAFSVSKSNISFDVVKDFTQVTSKKHTDINRLWVMGYNGLTGTKAQLRKITKFPSGIRYSQDESNLYLTYMLYDNARAAGFINDLNGKYNHIKFANGTYTDVGNFYYAENSFPSEVDLIQVNGFDRLEKFNDYVDDEARARGILVAQLYEKNVLNIKGIYNGFLPFSITANVEEAFEAEDNCGSKIQFNIDWKKSKSKDSGVDWNDHPYECVFEITALYML